MSLRPLISNQTDVFLTLAHHVSSSEAKDKNLVFSPLSLHVVLSLITAGSSGLTRDELLTFLRSKSCDDLNKVALEITSHVTVDGSPRGGPNLKFANGVWVDQRLPLKQSFKDVVDWNYKASINQVDLLHQADKVAMEVNSWAEEQTNGLVKEVLPRGSVTEDTKLILANALYFKGTWDEKFDASRTYQDDFYLLNGGSTKVPFMTTQNDQFVDTYWDCKVLRLPYEQGIDTDRQFSMYVFLPHQIDGLPSLMEKLSSEPGFLNKHLPFKKVEVDDFKLPKFKFSFGFEASDVLKSLGVEKPFSMGGLTEMVDSSMGDELQVSGIFQKSYIEINEEGTEAAAVTVADVTEQCYSPPEDPVDFVADHPFIFIIREDTTGALLFMGHVINPSL